MPSENVTISKFDGDKMCKIGNIADQIIHEQCDKAPPQPSPRLLSILVAHAVIRIIDLMA